MAKIRQTEKILKAFFTFTTHTSSLLNNLAARFHRPPKLFILLSCASIVLSRSAYDDTLNWAVQLNQWIIPGIS